MDKKIIQRLGDYPNEKYRLALMYSPHLSRKSALRLLNAYIHRADGLLPALEATGYSRSARHFTPKQLALVLEYLGEPFDDEGYAEKPL